jgi:F-type H+-transporting ATPase subunit delta
MTNRSAARRYARALFDVALKEGDLPRVETELSGFAGVFAAHETLARVLTSPGIPVSRKRALVETLLEKSGDLTPALVKLLRLLADRDRLALVPELADAFRERLLQHQGVVRAEVATAVPLSDAIQAAIEQGLAQATGRTVRMTTRVDPGLIGGAVARIGSTVYDGSVARHLERLKDVLGESQA